MRKIPFYLALVLSIVMEAVLFLSISGKMQDVKQDPVKINACLHAVSENFGDESQYPDTLYYSVIDENGSLLYSNKADMSRSLNEAIRNNDTILDVVVDGSVLGKIIFHNDMSDRIAAYRRQMIISAVVISLVQMILVLGFFFYLHRKILNPFAKMNAFAVRVAQGNLDLPLMLDRGHVFGAFTEAFDLMRSELKKARTAEKRANDEKKEVIAKLSHDIKTPVASIKSTSEVGYELSGEERTKEMFHLINAKSDQITTLVDNLFNSSVHEVTEIAVNPSAYSSEILTEMIEKADYLGKAGSFQVPDCRIYVDKIRLQQALDNIFMNSYKYAGTDIGVSVTLQEEQLIIRIADTGDGVAEEELPLLKEKYRRGSNVTGKDGAGLGLYLTNYYLDKMGGSLVLENADPGFVVYLNIRTA